MALPFLISGAAVFIQALRLSDRNRCSLNWKDEEEIARYLMRIVKKDAYDRSGLLYGIGHAVYTLSDPRAVLLREKIRELAEAKSMAEEFGIYERVAKIAPVVFKNERNSQKVIAPNVDFYSGFVYTMLNIPVERFNPIFAVARVAGWCAHRLEEIISGGRIIRPAYRNIFRPREYIPMGQR